jgi:hypothetical protein
MNRRAANGAGYGRIINPYLFLRPQQALASLAAPVGAVDPHTGSLPHMSAQSSHTAPGRFVVSTYSFTNSINNFFTPSAASVSGNSFDQMMQQVR